MSSRRVVLTGSGIYCPTGQDPQSVYREWVAGNSSFKEFPPQHSEIVRYRGLCENLEINLLPDRKVQKVVTRRDIIGLIVAMKAAKSANVPDTKIDPERFAMYVGASSTQIGDLLPYTELIAQSAQTDRFDSRVFGAGLMSSVNPMVMMQNLMNNSLCYASIALDIRGVNANFVDFQSAGLRAIGEAFEALRGNRAEIALAGGVAVMPDPYYSHEGVAMGFLQDATKGSMPPEIRSFDRSGFGTILSEGSAFLVLETLEHAQKRGAPILAEITDFSCASDAGFAYVDGRETSALIDCLKQVGTAEGKVIDVVGIGNGIAGEDFSELCAYQEAAKSLNRKVRVTSIKPSVGEMSEASGAASLVLALEGLKNGSFYGTQRYQGTVEPLTHVELPVAKYNVNKSMVVTARGFSGVSCALRISAFAG